MFDDIFQVNVDNGKSISQSLDRLLLCTVHYRISPLVNESLRAHDINLIIFSHLFAILVEKLDSHRGQEFMIRRSGSGNWVKNPAMLVEKLVAIKLSNQNPFPFIHGDLFGTGSSR